MQLHMEIVIHNIIHMPTIWFDWEKKVKKYIYVWIWSWWRLSYKWDKNRKFGGFQLGFQTFSCKKINSVFDLQNVLFSVTTHTHTTTATTSAGRTENVLVLFSMTPQCCNLKATFVFANSTKLGNLKTIISIKTPHLGRNFLSVFSSSSVA